MNSLLTDSRASQLHLPDIVGQGYGTFWRFKGRYRVCKGSRASKKSKTTALWYIVNLMRYPQANLLVIRKVYRTLHDSCFTDLKWAISRLGVQAFWDVKESPLELTYKPTGQKILFRGLDDPLKVTSIAAEHGYLCWAWIEEAYEISSEADFNMIDESMLALALINQILSALGKPVLPIESAQLEQLISTGFTTVSALVNWWFNNSFTLAALAGDEEYERRKNQVH